MASKRVNSAKNTSILIQSRITKPNIAFEPMTWGVAKQGYAHSSQDTFTRGYKAIDGNNKILALRNYIKEDVRRTFNQLSEKLRILEEKGKASGLDEEFFKNYAKRLQKFSSPSLLSFNENNIKSLIEPIAANMRISREQRTSNQQQVIDANLGILRDYVRKVIKTFQNENPTWKDLIDANKIIRENLPGDVNNSGNYKFTIRPATYLAGIITELSYALATSEIVKTIQKGEIKKVYSGTLKGSPKDVSDIVFTSQAELPLLGVQVKTSLKGPKVRKDEAADKAILWKSFRAIKDSGIILYASRNKRLLQEDMSPKIAKEVSSIFNLFNGSLVLLGAAKAIISRDIFGETLSDFRSKTFTSQDMPSAYLIVSGGSVYKNRDIIEGLLKCWQELSNKPDLANITYGGVTKSHVTNLLDWPTSSDSGPKTFRKDVYKRKRQVLQGALKMNYNILLTAIQPLLKSFDWDKQYSKSLKIKYDFDPFNFAQPL